MMEAKQIREKLLSGKTIKKKPMTLDVDGVSIPGIIHELSCKQADTLHELAKKDEARSSALWIALSVRTKSGESCKWPPKRCTTICRPSLRKRM